MTTTVFSLVMVIACFEAVTLGGRTNGSDTLDTAEKKETVDETQYAVKIPAGSELLLELMVRIAAQPEQWDKVHKLLRNIDDDLITSRDVIRRLETDANLLKAVNNKINHRKTNSTSMPYKHRRSKDEKQATRHTSHTVEQNRSIQRNSADTVEEKKLPVSSSNSNVQLVNISKVNSDTTDENQLQRDNKLIKMTYQRNFAYHRVTGTPVSLNKPPKAYIAVSVPDPQPRVPPSSSRTSNEEDAILENELHRLNPWKRGHDVTNTEKLKWPFRNRNKNDRVV